MFQWVDDKTKVDSSAVDEDLNRKHVDADMSRKNFEEQAYIYQLRCINAELKAIRVVLACVVVMGFNIVLLNVFRVL